MFHTLVDIFVFYAPPQKKKKNLLATALLVIRSYQRTNIYFES